MGYPINKDVPFCRSMTGEFDSEDLLPVLI